MKKFLFNILCITIFLNIWVPKGGIKIQDIPVTFGNVLYFVLLILFFIYLLFRQKIYKDKMQLLIFISIVFFAFRIIFAFLNDNMKFSDIIQYLIPLSIYPFGYIITYNCIRDKKQLGKVLKIVSIDFLVICLYGLIQNIFGIDKTTIPGITVNYSDYKESPLWYLQKDNGQGDASKMISTYQNGNIFGVNLLLIFPLVFETSKKDRTKFIYIALFLIVGMLTLSRSVWLGIGIYLLFRFILNSDLKLKAIFIRILLVISLIIAVPYAFNNVPQLQARLMQTTSDNISSMSGRLPNTLNLLHSSSNSIVSVFFGPYGIMQYDGNAYEMTYFAIYMLSGLIGLLVFLTPIILLLYKLKKHKKINAVAKGCYYGILVYAITAFIEGAFWLPPTALNLWIIAGIGMVGLRLEKHEGFNEPYKNITFVVKDKIKKHKKLRIIWR